MPNYKSYIDSIPSLKSIKSINLFEKHHVYSKTELYSRVEIEYENYSKRINIEARTMIQMASRRYFPAILKYIKELADTINSVRTVSPDIDTSRQEELLSNISDLFNHAQEAQSHLVDCMVKAESISRETKQAKEKTEKIRGQVLLDPDDDILEKRLEERYPLGYNLSMHFKDEVIPAMEDLRRPIDELELIMPKDMWPGPSYGDMLFEV